MVVYSDPIHVNIQHKNVHMLTYESTYNTILSECEIIMLTCDLNVSST